jgi:hypothetical protein
MRAAILFGLLGLVGPRVGASEVFTNGPERAVLIELYTSEGCSSCPPADQWLGSLRTRPGLWKEFVPVEFHVNYWNDLGWKDRLSSSAITAREYVYATAWGCQPYTPCFARNGVQWKPGWGAAGGAGAPTGVLTVKIGDDGACTVRFVPGPAARSPEEGGYEVHLAVLGGGISSQVTGGENSGKSLTHEFVVLGITDHDLSPAEGGQVWNGTAPLPRPIAVEATRRAFAAWVTVHGEMEPIQSTGGWLP